MIFAIALMFSGVAVADEPGTEEHVTVVVMTLSEWLESEDGQAVAAELIAEEAANSGNWVTPRTDPSAAEVEFELSEQDRRHAEDAMSDAIESCGVQFESVQPMFGGVTVDVAMNYVISLDDFISWDFNNGTTTFEMGYADFGTRVDVATLLASPGDTADCVEMQLGSIYDRLAEEAEKVMDGDFETFERVARAAALKIAVNRAHEIDADFGEALDVLVRLSTMKDPC